MFYHLVRILPCFKNYSYVCDCVSKQLSDKNFIWRWWRFIASYARKVNEEQNSIYTPTMTYYIWANGLGANRDRHYEPGNQWTKDILYGKRSERESNALLFNVVQFSKSLFFLSFWQTAQLTCVNRWQKLVCYLLMIFRLYKPLFHFCPLTQKFIRLSHHTRRACFVCLLSFWQLQTFDGVKPYFVQMFSHWFEIENPFFVTTCCNKIYKL